MVGNRFVCARKKRVGIIKIKSYGQGHFKSKCLKIFLCIDTVDSCRKIGLTQRCVESHYQRSQRRILNIIDKNKILQGIHYSPQEGRQHDCLQGKLLEIIQEQMTCRHRQVFPKLNYLDPSLLRIIDFGLPHLFQPK